MRDGWTGMELGELFDLVAQRHDPGDIEAELPYLGLENLETGLPTPAGFGRAGDVSSSVTPFEPDDVLFGRLRPYLRKVVHVDRPGVCTPEILVLRARDQVVLPRYLHLLVSSETVIERCVQMSAGSRMPRTSAADLAGIEVDVPSLVVQRRVVDLVDALDTYAAAARARHETARAARNAVISERLLQGSGDGWERTTLGEAAEVTIGRQRSPKNATGDHMTNYLRAANVKDGYLDLSDVKEMNFSPHEQDTYGLRPGDVLVTEGCGSLAQLGACAVWNGGAYEGPVCFQNTLIRLRSTERTDPGFLGLWGQWAFETGLFASIATGTNIFHLGVEQTRRLPLHLPPIPVQRDLSALASAFGSEIEGSAAAEKAALATRSALLDELLSGEREVPGSYDELVGLVA